MLKITNLNKSFGSKNVLKNISFSAPAGKITGFIGKNDNLPFYSKFYRLQW